jgi:hypothetical protein
MKINQRDEGHVVVVPAYVKDLALKTLNKQELGLEEGVKHLTDRVYHLLREVGRIGT